MGDCKFCGLPAGFLKSEHQECAEKYQQGIEEITGFYKDSLNGNLAWEDVRTRVKEATDLSKIPAEQADAVMVAVWEQAVESFLEDKELDVEEENNLTSYKANFDLTESDLDLNGMYTRFIQGIVLRELMEGKIPQRFNYNGLPFNFQKSETLIWAFWDVDYLEDKTKREYRGGSSGVSVRIARGVYYRTGGFRGTPIETTERKHIGTGIMAVTNKHIYFASDNKNFRVRLDKIVTFTPFKDAVGIQSDSASSKPQFFITGEGWFTYNLLVNAANVE